MQDANVPWGPIGEIIYLRTYSRFLPDKRRREYWHETVRRAVNYSKSLGPLEDGEEEALFDLWYSLKGAPAGRTLWIGDTPLSYSNPEANFNCAFEMLDDPKAFHDMQLLLMSGAGVGFRVTQDVVARLNETIPLKRKPALIVVPYEFYGYESAKYSEHTRLVADGDGVPRLVIGDSREGWADAIKLFLELIADGVPIIRIDANSVRPKGERLKRFGGYASGPEPLIEFFVFANLVLFDANRPHEWTDTKALDLANLIARATVAGGTRRSAQIGLGDSDEFARAKTGEWATIDEAREWIAQGAIPRGKIPPWRAQSNNSLLFWERPSKARISSLMESILEYGEPGFINASEANRRRNGEFDGVNPCLVGDTLIPVAGGGLKFIAELDGQLVPILDGDGNIVYAKAEKTGENEPILRVELSDGSEYEVTPWHEFVLADGTKKQAQHLELGDELMPSRFGGDKWFGSVHRPNDAYIDGWLVGDGTWHGKGKRWAKLYLYPPKFKYASAIERAAGKQFTRDSAGRMVMYFTGERECVPKDRVPKYVLEGDKETVSAFIRGLFESDGHIAYGQNGWLVQLSSIRKSLLQDVQALLRLFGIRSHIALMRRGGKRSMPDGHGGKALYDTKDVYRLTVSNAARFVAEFGFGEPTRGPYDLREKPVRVVRVVDTGKREDVYCLGVPTTNSFDLPTCHSGNCSEILLRNKGFCNLTTTNIRAFASQQGIDTDGLASALRLATRHAMRITNVDIGGRLADWGRVQSEDRLIGVSFTGFMDAITLASYDDDKVARLWRFMRDVVHEEAKRYARYMGIPLPKLMTTVKPEGTWSLLPGVSAGIHDAYAPYYIRRVRISEDDAVAQALVQLGFPHEKDLFAPNTLVFEFPVATPAKRSANEVSAIEMLERYKLSMQHWTDHNTSITVAVGEDEVDRVVDWLHENWDSIVGISFLRKDTSVYPQQPYEAIPEGRYKELKAKMPRFDRKVLDQIEGGFGLFMAVDDIESDCDSGHCPVR